MGFLLQQKKTIKLRLEETLSLYVGDIDASRKRVHIRRGKRHKNRLAPLPDLALLGLRELWTKHRNPILLFPNATGSLERIQKATLFVMHSVIFEDTSSDPLHCNF